MPEWLIALITMGLYLVFAFILGMAAGKGRSFFSISEYAVADRGLGLVGSLRMAAPGVRIVVMSWSDSLDNGLASCGADAFVRKTFRPSELFAAIQAAGGTPPH